jgi:hypothetical protein
MDKLLDQIVRMRAGNRCEYCLIPQSEREFRFQIDHVIARQHGGTTASENLALCCSRCNLHKGPNLAGIDITTGQMVRLFNPRTDVWADHFQWQNVMVVGVTDIGRATITVLKMNDVLDLAARFDLQERRLFPPV